MLGDFFPVPQRTSDTQTQSGRKELDALDTLPKAMTAVRVHEDSKELLPGQAYAIYHTQDVLGCLPEEYDTVVKRAAKWAGVEEDYVCGVVERYENRLARWWAGVRRKEKAGQSAPGAEGEGDDDEVRDMSLS